VPNSDRSDLLATKIQMGFDELFDGFVEFSAGDDFVKASLQVPACGGVCLFVSSDNQPVLLALGADLRHLVRQRLSEDQDDGIKRRVKLRPVVRGVWYRRGYSRFEVQLHYFRIAQAVYPHDYHEFFPKLDTWFICVDRQSQYPFFEKANTISSDGRGYWGPFATGKAAGKFLEGLQSVFGLCRDKNILAQSPCAVACSYAQMAGCVTVCDGSVPAERYRQVIDEAVSFLDGKGQEYLACLRQKMLELSGSLQFEQAQRVKVQIADVEKLLGPAYRWVGPMDRFYVLVFQKGPDLKLPEERRLQPSISSFIIGPGLVSQIEPFPLTQAQRGCGELLNHLNLTRLRQGEIHFGNTEKELLAWAAGLLYKSAGDKGLFVRVGEGISADELAIKVVRHFQKPHKNSHDKLSLDAYNLAGQDDNFECYPDLSGLNFE